MSTTTITKKGQITIPKQIREKLGLKEGDKVIVKFDGKKTFIRKIPSIFSLQDSVPVPEDIKKLSWKEIEKKAHDHIAKRVKS
ncbi:AbrB/MazE/SpoVT family DNA-binding domain-containing protein [Candidatus Atribacteria bacterium 1244-E10-H5-B2]|nr:AbrB/MazE/SpoVT family DNA-binding domain-containing protein [Actinomycetota bacterium]RXG62841.1 MAG: AbrB/MazE/SpoVT family DNA-binding domain-containing protein [Candidatus Atribacteria bacterium 1244-E10-H5-B2]